MNWFRKGEGGRFLWPGFGENSRVLKWIVERLEGTGEGVETALGVLPTADALDLDGLDIPAADLDVLLSVDKDIWAQEAAQIPAHFGRFGDRLPAELTAEYEALLARLAR